MEPGNGGPWLARRISRLTWSPFAERVDVRQTAVEVVNLDVARANLRSSRLVETCAEHIIRAGWVAIRVTGHVLLST